MGLRVSSAARWWYVLRYHRLGQLAHRVAAIAKRRGSRLLVGRVPPLFSSPPVGTRSAASWAWLAPSRFGARDSRTMSARATAILDGRFSFLGEERALSDPIDWHLSHWPEAERLWKFHLHYQEFLLDLAWEAARSGEPRWSNRAWELVLQWIEASQPGDPRSLDAAWHPFCISRRLPAWIVLWQVARPPKEVQERVLQSVACQAAFLARRLERDLGGNHLMENLRALFLAGAFLEGPLADGWQSTAARLLQRELREQILPHGEHFERSPMYHAAMLEAVLDIQDAAGKDFPELTRSCRDASQRMAAFLAAIVHPDGEIPLLGDSALGEAPTPESLLARAAGSGESDRLARRKTRVLPPCDVWDPSSKEEVRAYNASQRTGDYWVFRDGGDFLLFDAGPVGADHLPAHAHADLLTLEASLGGHRLFVDSGVFDYGDGAMRRYCRSSAAHNVLVVDDTDQCDMWSRFRMGYRGWPEDLEQGATAGFAWARATHNAYRRLGVVRVGRYLACRPGGPWLCADWAMGTGRHELCTRIHLHPECAVERSSDGAFRIDHFGRTVRLQFLVPGEVSLETAWYCPEFGRKQPASVVCWRGWGDLPAWCGWSLSWGESDGAALLERAGTGLSLTWTEGSEESRLRVAAW